MNKDLTVGKPSKVLRKFCLPLFGSVIFQQLYTVSDSLVAGKFVGENALAAVGNSYEITLFFMAFAFGCNIGCSVIVSSLFGAKKYSELKTAVYTVLIASGVLCFCLMAVGLLFGGGLLKLINTPEDIMADSKLYLDIYIFGLLFVFYYNVATGIFSALGDSKTPFYFLMCSSVSNILVDILFTTTLRSVFKRGVDGVAWATFLCQGVSCILALIFIIKRLKGIKTEGRNKVFSWSLLGKIAYIAIPSILQQTFVSVGNIIIQGIINTFGSGVIAGYSASIKLNNLVITSFNTLGTGMSNYTAQNLGAQKKERIHDGFKAGIKLVVLIGAVFSLLYFFLGKQLVHIFINDADGEAMRTGVMILKIISPFYFVVSSKLIADGVLRGAGKMKQFMFATFTDLILRVVLAKILSATPLGATGIWLAWPIGWLTATALSIVFYFNYLRKLNKSKAELLTAK